MNLLDNEYITEQIKEQLIDDGWTMGKLATARPASLTDYKGIGTVTAGRIINEAKRLVNQELLNEAAGFNIPEPTPEEPPASARVQRIRELNK